MTTRRLGCCIPFCRRTRHMEPTIIQVDGEPMDFAEVWICDKHWPPVATQLKADYRVARRKLRKSGSASDAKQCIDIFRNIRAAAIEIAAGL